MNNKDAVIFCIGLICIAEIKIWAKVKLELELSDGRTYTRVKGKKVYSPKEYFVKRQAYESINNKGEKFFWYDNDFKDIIKVSKYAHLQLLKLNSSITQ